VLFPPEFCFELDFSAYIWFRYLLSDTAYFHTFLAVASSFTQSFRSAPRVCLESETHISNAYALIAPRLSEPDACSDEAIAVVTILTIYHLMHHQLEIGIVHFHGLRRMVELRGGLVKLMSENRCLTQKPWRLALEFSLQDGSLPIYSLQDLPVGLDIMPSSATRAAQAALKRSCWYPGISASLLDLLLDIMQITRALNDTSATNKLEPMDYSDAVCVRLSRLLHLAPLRHQRPSDPMEDLVHLCLVAIMTTLMPEYGYNQARYDLLSNLLWHAVQRYADIPLRNDEVLLWAVFVGCATVMREGMQELILETCGRLGLREWVDVRRMLCRYAWICVFYDGSGRKLWEHAHGSRA
jgi:hypothetical protein